MSCSELVTIRDKNGDNPVNLWGAHAPYPAPIIVDPYEAEFPVMRQGEGGPGYVAAQIEGAAEDQGLIEMQIPNITAALLNALQTKKRRQPPEPIRVTIDGGIKTFYAVFTRDGFTPKNHTSGRGIELALKLQIIGTVA